MTDGRRTRDPIAPQNGACGRGCAPVPKTLSSGEDCLSEASSAALTIGTGAQGPEGPRTGATGFGSFCRNKRTSAGGGGPRGARAGRLCFGFFWEKKKALGGGGANPRL